MGLFFRCLEQEVTVEEDTERRHSSKHRKTKRQTVFQTLRVLCTVSYAEFEWKLMVPSYCSSYLAWASHFLWVLGWLVIHSRLISHADWPECGARCAA